MYKIGPKSETKKSNWKSPSYGIQPIVHLEVKSGDKFNIVQTVSGNPTIQLGYYPQSYVGDALNHTLNKMLDNQDPSLKPNGRAHYVTYQNPINNNRINYTLFEFEVNGEYYVCDTRNHATLPENAKYNNGQSIDITSAQWFKVEPLVWEITNWDNAPTFINPLGKPLNQNNILELKCKDVITCLPLFLNNRIGNRDEHAGIWQNSLVRAYLNGYDLNHEIKSLKNGDVKKTPSQLYDFQNPPLVSFIDEVFNAPQMTMSQLKSDNTTNSIINNIKRKKDSKYGITIDETPMSIDEQLQFYVENRMPFMLHGKSGIGKSRRIKDIDPNFVSLTLRNGILPEEVIGKDFTDEHGVNRWAPPSFYNALTDICEREPDKNHVLFLDEITNVNEHEQSLAYDIVLNHSIKPNFGKLPDNCVVVAAGNAKDESEAAYNMPEPLFRRFTGHIYLPLDVPSFLEWGSELRENSELTNIHPLISSFISTYPKLLYSEYDPEKEGKNYAVDPRAWEQVSDILYNNKGRISKQLLANKIGDNYADMLIAYASKNFITIEDIMEDNYDAEDIPTSIDEQYALVLSLRRANEQEVEKIRHFISKYLSGEMVAKFDFIWVNKDPERAMIIGELKEKQKDIQPENNIVNNSTTSKKIKITEFCDSNWKEDDDSVVLNFNELRKDIKAIYCDSEPKAECLCKAFHRLNKKWITGESFETTTHYTPNICYYNYGAYQTRNQIIDDEFLAKNFYSFDEVDFKGALSKEEIAQVEKLIAESKDYYKDDIITFCGTDEDWSDAFRRNKKAIHCKTPVQASILLSALECLGKNIYGKNARSPEITSSILFDFDNETYITNTGDIEKLSTIDPYTFNVLEFDEVDFDDIPFNTPTERKLWETYLEDRKKESSLVK